ncbi:MAG: hypothetical protein HOW73_00125 [Polyangiaceae bacterium]|nr:hypothetical protein [Polyangiaceae bacterium]
MDPSVLDPAAAQAARISSSFWWCLGASVGVWLLVVGACFVAVLHRRVLPPPVGAPNGLEEEDQRMKRVLGLFVVATALMLGVSVAASVHTARSIGRSAPNGVLTIQATAERCRWQFVTPGEDRAADVTTATEVHIPVGQAVKLELTSLDVVYGLSMPTLSRDREVIPGEATSVFIKVERPGRVVGRSADRRAPKYGDMPLVIVADPPEAYARWLERMRGG